MANSQVVKSAKSFSASEKTSPWGIFTIACTATAENVNAFRKALTACGLGNHPPQLHRGLPLSMPADSNSNDDIFRDYFTGV